MAFRVKAMRGALLPGIVLAAGAAAVVGAASLLANSLGPAELGAWPVQESRPTASIARVAPGSGRNAASRSAAAHRRARALTSEHPRRESATRSERPRRVVRQSRPVRNTAEPKRASRPAGSPARRRAAEPRGGNARQSPHSRPGDRPTTPPATAPTYEPPEPTATLPPAEPAAPAGQDTAGSEDQTHRRGRPTTFPEQSRGDERGQGHGAR
jgi:hypothetical protein